MASKSGKILLSMKGIGRTIKLMGGEGSFTRMEMYTRDNLKMISPTAREYIFIRTVPSIMDHGLKITSMGSVSRNGLMDHHMKGIPDLI